MLTFEKMAFDNVTTGNHTETLRADLQRWKKALIDINTQEAATPSKHRRKWLITMVLARLEEVKEELKQLNIAQSQRKRDNFAAHTTSRLWALCRKASHMLPVDSAWQREWESLNKESTLGAFDELDLFS